MYTEIRVQWTINLGSSHMHVNRSYAYFVGGNIKQKQTTIEEYNT